MFASIVGTWPTYIEIGNLNNWENGKMHDTAITVFDGNFSISDVALVHVSKI